MELRIPNLNLVMVSGRLTKDADYKVTSGGQSVLTMRIAVNNPSKDKVTGEWKDNPTFIGVDVWGDAAARLKDRLRKGSPVIVEGRLKGREYDDKATGQKRSVIDIVARNVQVMEKAGAAGAAPSAGAPAGGSGEDLEEVPF